jgi:protease IV
MSEMQPAGEKENWERQIIEKLARSALDEQRKSRNWGIFFKTLTSIYLLCCSWLSDGWVDASLCPGTTRRWSK